MSGSGQMIDWELAISTGVRWARPGPQVTLAEARGVVAELHELAAVVAEPVRQVTGMAGAEDIGQVAVVDRPGWIRANTHLASLLIDRLEPGRRRPSMGQRLTGAAIGAQVGTLFAALAGRVLGQFDPFTAPGRLYLVAPNVADAELALGVDPADFRLWVCLHEQTHRLQFTAAPWLPDHLQGIVGELLDDEEERGLTDVVREFVGPRETNASHRTLDEWFSSPAQRTLFDRANAVMALLEGHADVMMDRAGEAAIPSLAQIRTRFERRRTHTMLSSRLGRLLGLDRKLAQYREGAAFCRAVIGRVGVDGLNAVWASPELLPAPSEIARPHDWVARVHG